MEWEAAAITQFHTSSSRCRQTLSSATAKTSVAVANVHACGVHQRACVALPGPCCLLRTFQLNFIVVGHLKQVLAHRRLHRVLCAILVYKSDCDSAGVSGTRGQAASTCCTACTNRCAALCH